MNGRDVFEYALLRVVPQVERGECINAGVLVYCRAKSFVAARTHLDERRLLALDPGADVPGVHAALRAVEGVCAGGAAAGAGGARRPGAPFPLADRAPVDGCPARARAYGADRRSGGRGGTIAGPPGEVMDHMRRVGR